MKEMWIFVISLLLPMLYWRTISRLAKNYMKKPITRTKTGLQIHHLHHGIFFVFIASLILLFIGKNNYVIALLGVGLGLMFDFFIPSILIKSDRKKELKIYQETFVKTLILFLILIFIVIGLSFINF